MLKSKEGNIPIQDKKTKYIIKKKNNNISYKKKDTDKESASN